MDLISIIIIVAIIKKVIEKGKAEQDRIKKNTTQQNVWDQVAGQVKAGQAQSRQYTSTPNRPRSSSQNDQWQKLARENIEKAKNRAAEKLREVESALEIEDKPAGTYQMPKQNVRTTPAYEQITLQQVEHNHSERVSPAEHHHPEDVIPENMLGTIEDLMVKGYDGSLCFERDFLGEAMDMINRFTISTDIPNPSVDDVA